MEQVDKQLESGACQSCQCVILGKGCYNPINNLPNCIKNEINYFADIID